MDAQAGLGGEPSHALREQIHQTQLQLGTKLGALEGEVRAVTAQAKESIRERIEAARDVVDVRRHVALRPWLWSALAVGAGVLVARRTGRRRLDQPAAPRPGWLRTVAAPHLATIQTILVGRALSFAADRLRNKLYGVLSESPSRDEAD
jgi:hypothetical protein